MKLTPLPRSSRTAARMSLTVSATCWTPSPRSSSLKMLICELLKNGRWRLVVRELDAGVRIPHHDRLEARAGLARSDRRRSVWNATSQICSNPSTCSIHSSVGFMVWKFDVMWSMPSKPNRFLPPPPARAGTGTAPGNSGVRPSRSRNRNVVSPNGVVIENVAQRAAVVAWSCGCRRSACRRAPRAAGTSSRCPRPRRSTCRRRRGAWRGSAPRALRRRRCRRPIGWLHTTVMSPASNAADAGARAGRARASCARSRRSRACRRRTPRALEVVHVVVDAFEALDAERFELGHGHFTASGWWSGAAAGTRRARDSAPRSGAGARAGRRPTPNRRAEASCGTRQQSAIVGASPTQNAPADSRAARSNAARPGSMKPRAHTVVVAAEVLDRVGHRQVLERLDPAVDDLGEPAHARAQVRVRGAAAGGPGTARRGTR